ncbi:DUF4215 domain-containing protein [Archangium sp.]|uniref:DUF4215 domain-containing protein n=1 Tax=Archangium sp. TaxID=1872627 RepID=UPI002ED77E56
MTMKPNPPPFRSRAPRLSWPRPVLLGLVLLFNAAGCDAQLEPPSTPSTLEQASQPLVADVTPSLAPVCGDGLIEAGEACDDANAVSGDGCSGTCAIEPGFSCFDAPSICNTGCGDGTLGEGEQCDDGNSTGGDGCSAICTVEPSYVCIGATPSVCTVSCGDGIKAPSEACDDGNKTNGDGCSSTCTIEAAHGCQNTGKSVFYTRLGRRDCTLVSNRDLNTPDIPATAAQPALSTPDRYRIRYVAGAVSYSGTDNWFPGIFGVNPTEGSTVGAFSLGYNPPGRSTTREVAVGKGFPLLRDFDAPSGQVRLALIDVDCPVGNNTDNAVTYRVDALSICQLIPVITTPAEGATSPGIISGTATPGSTVKLYVDGSTTPACTTTTGADGTWTCTVPAITNEQKQTVVARSTVLSATESSTPRSFIGDVKPPETTIPKGPPERGPARTGRFEYASDDPTAHFECSLDGGAYVPCPEEYTVEPGKHTLLVRAVDPAGNVDPEPAKYEWTVVDDTVPDTTIPQGPPERGPARTGRFEYASDESKARFECSLDGGAYVPCEAEYTVQPGEHTLRVRAVDESGNVDPTPAEYTWTVVDDTRTFAGGGCGAVPGPSLVALLGLIALRRRNRR